MPKTLSRKIGDEYVAKVKKIIGEKAGKKSKVAHTFLEHKDAPGEVLGAIAEINGYVCQEVVGLDDEQADDLEMAFKEAVQRLRAEAKKDEQQKFDEYLAMVHGVQTAQLSKQPGPVTVLPHGTTLYGGQKHMDLHQREVPPNFTFNLKKANTSDATALAMQLRLAYGEKSLVDMKLDNLDGHVLEHFGFRFDLKKIPLAGRLIDVDSSLRYPGIGYSMRQRAEKLQTAMLLEGLMPVPCVLSDWQLRAIQKKLNDPVFIQARDAKRKANQPLSDDEIDSILAPQSAVGQLESQKHSRPNYYDMGDDSDTDDEALDGFKMRITKGPNLGG